jgi:hypothetical protein
MGGDCSNLCHAADAEEKDNMFVREPLSNSKNYQLPINMKTSRALPEEYFSASPTELLENLSPESIVKC